jgi:hypothetical protein
MAENKCDKCPYKEECHEGGHIDLVSCEDFIAYMVKGEPDEDIEIGKGITGERRC